MKKKKPLSTSLISFTSYQTLYSFSLFSFKYYFLIIFYSFFIQQNSTPITIKKKKKSPKNHFGAVQSANPKITRYANLKITHQQNP
jgi:hypothetical protein